MGSCRCIGILDIMEHLRIQYEFGAIWVLEVPDGMGAES
jgi:hypothetical protein